jgi:hypothetical protein
MAILQGGTSGKLQGVAEETQLAAHVTLKPIPYGNLGHYRCTHRFVFTNAQVAAARLFEVRNTHASNLIIPTSCRVTWLQTGAHTAAIEDSLDFFKVTSFSAVDTTNTVTPTASQKKSLMATPPGAAAIRGLTATGNVNGMTGGTMTKDGGSFAQLPQWLLLAMPTTPVIQPQVIDPFVENLLTQSFVFGNNEGFEIENRVLLGAAAASSVYIDFSWAEVTVI